MKKQKKLKVYTVSLKPKLTDEHVVNRFVQCIEKMDGSTINGATVMKFKTMLMKSGSTL
jgi:PII-like signaling protein